MSTDSAGPLAPAYTADIRQMMARAFAEPAPVPACEIPGGALPKRLEAWHEWSSDKVLPPPQADGEPAAAEKPIEYWVRCLPHRIIVIGPLLDVVEASSLAPGVHRKIEREVLRAYYRTYDALPLSPDLLDLMTRPGDEILVRWLEAARQRIMRSRTVGDARRERAAFRANALHHGATRAWTEGSTGAAELLADVFLLLRAVREDIDRALTRAIDQNISLGIALEAMDDEEEWAFERVLAHLTRRVVTLDDFEPSDREMIARFAADRPAFQTLLTPGGASERETGEPQRGSPVILHSPRSAPSPGNTQDRSGVNDEPRPAPPEDPHAEFRRILEALEDRILGRQQLCRDLALIGLGAACGVERQRILLCGPTGSGKSHSAQSLADVLGRPFLRMHTPDITTTGFRGIEISTALEAFASSTGGTLRGSVLFLDEVDKARIPGPDVDGNSRAAQLGLMSSLLHLCEGSPVTLDRYDSSQLETAGMLVIGAGAFEGRFADRCPSTEELERWGWMTEFAARWTTRLVLSPPGPAEAQALLRSSEQSVRGQLGPLLDALNLNVEIPEATVRYAVHQWTRLGTDLRSVSAWLTAAARRKIVAALEKQESEIVVTPDDLRIPPR